MLGFGVLELNLPCPSQMFVFKSSQVICNFETKDGYCIYLTLSKRIISRVAITIAISAIVPVSRLIYFPSLFQFTNMSEEKLYK